MTLWQFLKQRMLAHGDRPAFTDGAVTYAQLVGCIAACERAGGHRLVLARGRTRQEQAVQILRILAGGNVAVPVSDDYGRARQDAVTEVVDKDADAHPGLAFVLFTSGTTGRQKGVMLSDENIIENIRAIDGYFDVRAGQKLLIARPLVHSAALTGELLFGLYKGLEIQFYEQPFQPGRLAAALKASRADILGCTPTMLYHLSPYLAAGGPGIIAVSGERLTERLVGTLRERLPDVKFYNAYGLTENGPRVAALCPRDFFDRPGSVGKPVRNTRIRIEDGELLVQSGSVMRGYLGDAALTREKLRGGWLHTGDSAYLDGDGFLYIRGRLDEMILRAGVNVYPAEIEDAACTLDGVQSCVAYGEDDERYGQKICLQVTGTADADTIRRQLAAVLPPHLVPAKVEVVAPAALTASGKKPRMHSRA